MVTPLTNLSRAQIEQHVFAALAFVLEDESQKAFELDANLVKTLGLNSEDGVDLACYLSKALGIEISHKTNLLYEDRPDQNHRLRNVGDLIDLLVESAGTTGEL